MGWVSEAPDFFIAAALNQNGVAAKVFNVQAALFFRLFDQLESSGSLVSNRTPVFAIMETHLSKCTFR